MNIFRLRWLIILIDAKVIRDETVNILLAGRDTVRFM